MKLCLMFAAQAFALSPLYADVTLAPLFQNGAVLQRDRPVPIWGSADPGEEITVTFGGQSRKAVSDTGGYWRVDLDPLPASAIPRELLASGKNVVRVSDVLVGEVWLCSGQSNMAWLVKRADRFPEEAAAAHFPQIRHFGVATASASKPQSALQGSWSAATPDTVGTFTAVGYFFGRDLHQRLKVPVGLINASYSGTRIESWMSSEALRSEPVFEIVLKRWRAEIEKYPRALQLYETRMAHWKADHAKAKATGIKFDKPKPRKPDGPGTRREPSSLYNAMVHPLIPYAARGTIWYQGEANGGQYAEYGALFSALIRHWRKDFEHEDAPFYFVQLANFAHQYDKTSRQWAFQREAQMEALKLPNTGMAVAIDIGDSKDIHPTNKQDVGHRLALLASALTYGQAVEYSGPMYKESQTEGAALRVRFTHAKGLKLKDPDTSAFELAGEDRKFHSATAVVEGEELVISSPTIPKPIAVRYAWKNDPAAPLYNGADLPAAPFRSDRWSQ